MMRAKLILTALAITGVSCAAALNVASAASPTDATAPVGAQQPVRLAQATVTTPKPAKKTKRLKVEHPRTNWLNPQPEPPMAGKKPVQGNNWLNPQPEPPQPVTTKKPQ
ncbi:hypothetical protein [Bradyrhizobium betae]|uniref:Uncharacterized protein n=1 Tax=Bradyrhizobium betae TaxID=244734 RepID=A0A5P6P2D4_9BRAD|nr:hypothetical protein [Bradyrhizobium betae]MCS3727466.1 hypothetical protein [Bradyrhizobium betae]QFI72480.1 hypothetical protein F8237_08800 [Bradyrhizobium betae]